MFVCVRNKHGTPLMPYSPRRKARLFSKAGKATWSTVLRSRFRYVMAAPATSSLSPLGLMRVPSM